MFFIILGTELNMVFDWYSKDLRDVLEDEESALAIIPSIKRIREILLGIVKALSSCHKLGYSHGDLKPNNVLIAVENNTYTAVVADFGLSESETKPSLTSCRKSRHFYDAPDEKSTTSIDIYSCGLIGLQMLYFSIAKTPIPKGLRKLIKYSISIGDLPKTRIFLKSLLPGFHDQMLMETIVQCIQKFPLHRPKAGIMCHILDKSAMYAKANEAAKKFGEMIGSPSISWEELVFPNWYKHKFLPVMLRHFSDNMHAVLSDFLEQCDFPLVKVFQSFDDNQIQHFASALRPP